MQSGFEDDFTTPKKKRRSKAVAEDDYLLASPTPIVRDGIRILFSFSPQFQKHCRV